MGLEVVRYVLRFRLRFSDTWEPQVITIKSFMNERNIKTTGIQHETKPGRLGAFRIDINAIDSVLQASKAMLPFCLKKAEELKILIEYLEGRMTGNQAIERYNEEVRIGRLSGYVRDSVLPYTRAEGLRMAQLENARKARAAYAVDVNAITQDKIRNDHRELKLGYIRLSKKYGYSTYVIRRILGVP